MKRFTALLTLALSLIIPAAFAPANAGSPMSTASISSKTQSATSLLTLAKKHGETLALTEKQKASIGLWLSETEKHMRFLVHKTAILEKSVVRNALRGKDKASLLNKMEETNNLRKQILSQRLDCRDNLNKILDKTQWQKLVALYKTEVQ